MRQPDGMGADRYRERQNMAEAKHHQNNIYAIVTDTMDIIQSGFSSHKEAADWLDDRLKSVPEPEWSKEDVEIEAIR